MRIEPCELCGTPKMTRELGNGQAACPHCDRITCLQSTCDLKPCVEFERAKP